MGRWRAVRLASLTALIIAGIALGRDAAGAANGPFYTLNLPNPHNAFASAVATGDVNADGKADLIVGALNETVAGNEGQGQTYVFSGANGSLLYTLVAPNPQAGAHFGRSVATGDVSGDGKADIIVGAEGETVAANAFQGRAYVFSGATGLLLYTFTTPNPEWFASFGTSVAAGDVNADARPDVIVGAYGETAGGNAGQGRVYVFSGMDGSLLRTLTTPNPLMLAQFGLSVAAGDLNSDGNADVIVGAPNETVGANAGEGRVYGFSGANGAVLRTLTTPHPQASARFGYSVAAGDLNFDGKSDIVVGADNETVGTKTGQGRAYGFSGFDGSLLREVTTPNPEESAQFGLSVAAGDINGDSRADMLVGAENETVAAKTGQGRAYTFSGATGALMTTVTTPHAQVGAQFGIAVAVGDTNGDGTRDIAVGASNATVNGNAGQGRAYVFSGTTSALLTTVTSPNRYFSMETNVGFGNAVAAADVNVDGKAEVIVGAPNATTGAYIGLGRVLVYAGADRSLIYTLATPNPQSNAGFGVSVAAGDTNGDGKPDIIVGAYDEKVLSYVNQGRVYVFSGATGALLRTLTTPNPEPNAKFGVSVAAGDTNADGKADIMVGAYNETVTPNAGQGRAYVFSGANGALLRTLTTPNAEANANFGMSVAAGDLNADTTADIVVSSEGETVGGNAGQGRVYGFSGADGTLLRTLTTPNPEVGAQFGESIAVGDLNADLSADIIVGADNETVAGNLGQGRVYGFSGADGSLLRTLTTPNAQAGAQFGYSVASADVSGDGIADIAVGAVNETVGLNAGQGRAYTFSGVDGALLRTDTTPNAEASAKFGYSVAARDVNGDAKADIVVGAGNETVGGATAQGRAYVFAGVAAMDTDGDGCSDPKEPLLGLNSTNPWDFYSVPVPALIAAADPTLTFANSAVSAADAQAVFGYFKAGAKTGEIAYEQDLNLNGVKDGLEYDRSVAGPGISGPPNGIVGASDAQLAFSQFKAAYLC